MSGGVLEIPAFVIGVAGLFTSCVEAFAYFKLYQHATREIEVVLLKLDTEKARLLIWGDNVGIFSATQRNPHLLDQRVADVIERILEQIQDLLTDSDKLRTTYGVRTLDSPLARAVDYISSKSLSVFRTSASRFLTRNAARLNGFTRGSTAARTRWAIHEREKFQELVIDLSHFVDRLFELIDIGRATQDRIIIEDIESILDISRLDIVEEATENYPAYSKAARSAKALTEAGTLDRRTVEEHIRDVEDIRGLHPETGDPNPNASDSFLWEIQVRMNEKQRLSAYFVFTNPCRKQRSDQPCDLRVLGRQVNDNETVQPPGRLTWDLSSGESVRRNTLGDLVYRAIGVRQAIRDQEFNLLGDLLKLGTTFTEPTAEQQAFIDAELPIVDVFIYCAPCVCLIHTALSICRKLQSPYVGAHLRPDDRLVSSCCRTVDRSLGVRSVCEWVRDWEASSTHARANLLGSHLDIVWLDRRLEHLDYEEPYDYREPWALNNRFLILGEVDSVAHMVQGAPGRMPRATDIWQVTWHPTPSRSFFCRFIESRPSGRLVPATEVQDSNASTPTMPLYPASVLPPALGVRRPASPPSSASESKTTEVCDGAPDRRK
ncbi:prion-inhibition and propagation-domain-containing protein [Dactylonectria macrodidyma]|uniref:Prion-inhibition and propagation-domain-containing protein n=1 Tax=Dactylonectria macrodidyma TaxID=307937 RepID=A0A9P9IAG3_9HYPO|nr:prion-inhibition and propagation-domain-containing protein [Dactylonectria macrodidyma]